jgi:hypothetical protein
MAPMSDPDDLLAPRVAGYHFATVRRGGYDPRQVDETIKAIEVDLRVAVAERNAATHRASEQAAQLQALHSDNEALRRSAVTAGAPTFESMGERISNMLRLAEEEAAEIRRAAEEQAAALRQAVAAEAEAVRERVADEERALGERQTASQAEAERIVIEARQHAEQVSAKAQARADELGQKAQAHVAKLDADSEAGRARVEEDFELAQRARRTEAARVEAEREQASVAAAQRRVAAAEEHAHRMVAEADQHIRRMVAETEASAVGIRAARDDVAGRLAEVRQLLAGLPDLSDPPARAAQQAPPEQDAPQQQAPQQVPAAAPHNALELAASRVGSTVHAASAMPRLRNTSSAPRAELQSAALPSVAADGSTVRAGTEGGPGASDQSGPAVADRPGTSVTVPMGQATSAGSGAAPPPSRDPGTTPNAPVSRQVLVAVVVLLVVVLAGWAVLVGAN